MNELTPRERRILALYMQGVYQKDIAKDVHLSRNSVQYLLGCCQQKLGLKNRAELQAWARMQGFHHASEQDEQAMKREYDIALREGGYYACFPEKDVAV